LVKKLKADKMLQPKRSKHRKMQKGRMKGNAKRGATIAFGSYALKALEQHWITDRQIEAARQALTREMKREGMVWIRIFPDKPITRKPLEVRMGKGKGNLEFWAAVVKPGRILFEVDGVTEAVAKASLSLAAGKLPIKTKFIARRDVVNI
jgi:large subunit ribosomal protein L16